MKIYFGLVTLTLFFSAQTLLATEVTRDIYSCAAFARMSGVNLPDELPCVDYDGNSYKNHNFYCKAMTYQSRILNLSGCNQKYIDKWKSMHEK